MIKANLVLRGHLLKIPLVKRKNSFSRQPSVYDMTSFGIWLKKHAVVLTARGDRLLPKLLIQQLGHFLDRLSFRWGKILYYVIK
jgi:hypothetical protein